MKRVRHRDHIVAVGSQQFLHQTHDVLIVIHHKDAGWRPPRRHFPHFFVRHCAGRNGCRQFLREAHGPGRTNNLYCKRFPEVAKQQESSLCPDLEQNRVGCVACPCFRHFGMHRLAACAVFLLFLGPVVPCLRFFTARQLGAGSGKASPHTVRQRDDHQVVCRAKRNQVCWT